MRKHEIYAAARASSRKEDKEQAPSCVFFNTRGEGGKIKSYLSSDCRRSKVRCYSQHTGWRGGGWGGQTTALSKLLGAQDTLVLQDNQVCGSTRGGEGRQAVGIPCGKLGFQRSGLTGQVLELGETAS